MKSIGQMLEECQKLCGTLDISPLESLLLKDMMQHYLSEKKSTSAFSDEQVEIIVKIYERNLKRG